MINGIVKAIIVTPFAVVTGVAIGVGFALTGPSFMGAVTSAYDSAFPVVSMRGTLELAEPGAVLVRITGEKHRGEECRLVRVYGYRIPGSGPKIDAVAERADPEASSRLRAAGEYDIGVWRVRPVAPTDRGVEVWAHYECFGRPVMTKVADVKI